MRRHAPLLVTLFLGLLAAAPLFANGGFLITRGGGDSPFLLERLHQLLAALAGGQFPARWMPDADYGYGYPFFNFYAALPYYLAALLKIYGFSYVVALKLTQLAALLIAAAGTYGWVRSWPRPLSRPQAVLAAAAYTFAPFHLVNLYVRGDSLSELWAMSLYPLVLWSAQRCLSAPSRRRAFGLAITSALLILCHNISALNFMPFVGLYLILGGAAVAAGRRAGWAGKRWPKIWRPMLIGLLAVAWGLLLSAFFWLPALREIGTVQIANITQGYFYYGNHFRGTDLVQRTLFFSAETGAGLPTPFSMGLAQAVVTTAGLVALATGAVRQRRWAATHSFLLLGLALSTYMVTPASAWVWAHVPLVLFTQFPWRFLSIQALFAAVITAYLVPGDSAATGNRSRAVRWALALGLGLALAVTSLGRLRPDFIPLSDVDVTAQRLKLLEYFSANIGSTVGYEYLPRAVPSRPYSSDSLLDRPARLKVLRGQATGAQLDQQGTDETWSIQAFGGPATVALPTLYWPGWTASVDGRSTAIRPAGGLGWISFDLEPGAHTVTLQMGRTPVRAAAEALSLLALVVPLGYLAVGESRYWRQRAWQALPAPRPALLVVGSLGLAGLALAGSLILHLATPSASTLPLSIDFVQLTYLHRDIIHFAGGTQLVSVTYNAEHLARGQTLMVNTTWRPAGPGAATLSLVPASNLLDAAPLTLATATEQMGASGPATRSSALAIPKDIPPGVYFVTVQWADRGGLRTALTGAGRERGLVNLAPVWIDDPGPAAEPGAPVAQFGPAIELLSARPALAEPGVLSLNLNWHALQDIAENDQISLRLRDVAGAEWAGSDTQLGYGYYPTPMWRPGEVIPDFYRLPLPDGTPPGDYLLDLNLYNPASGASLGTTTLTATVTAATARGQRVPRYVLTPALGLASVEITGQFKQGDAPELRASWLTTAAPATNFRARWTLTAGDGTRISQVLDLAPGSPTTDWPASAFVLGRVRLGTSATMPPGTYSLSIRLVGGDGQPVGSEVPVGQVQVLGRPRSFAIPPVQTSVNAKYGDVIELWGYDAQQAPGALRLTLVWSALTTPGRDYKFFVHLFNPDDGFVATQFDAMPHDFAYPTALWIGGEVVTDTVSLSLQGVAAGHYAVAVGWYDPNNPAQRLPAHDAQGRPLEGDRVVLPLAVHVP
jgi:hypothetical protein